MTDWSQTTICPYCGEGVDVTIDESGGNPQEYVEDCPVCCRPWSVTVTRAGIDAWQVILRTEDE